MTCTGSTAGNALQGSTVTVVFAAGLTSTGIVNGPGAGVVPLLPPPPPVILPPLPPPLLQPPPPVLLPPIAAPASAAVAPEIPVIPEAETVALLAVGLGLLGLRALWRRRR